MKLKMLIKGIDVNRMNGSDDIEVSGIAYDSRAVKEGNAFIAVKGEKVDGHNYMKDAMRMGAAAIVYERELPEDALSTDRGVTFVHVSDSRKALAFLSNNFYKQPSEHMTVIGITGTNGKTTTTYLVKSILETRGKDVGLIGTIHYMIKDKTYDAPHTTPESPEFQSILAQMLESDCSYAVTEVSSHALAQRRADYTQFKVAVFTNLTRDHLDFHYTMEEYFQAKTRLFSELLSQKGTAVINFDDIWGRKLITELKGNILTYGIEEGADITAQNIQDSFEGLRFDIRFKQKKYAVSSPLIGMHNVYNILSAAGASVALNIPWDVITKGIRKMESVKGRFEKVDLGQDFLCVIDYAHTEDALERLIYTTRELLQNAKPKDIGDSQRKGRIITVFGCGGNRDKGKRPKMGSIATKLSDAVIITSDNPRDENPDEIIQEIAAGASRRNYVIEADRKNAIHSAVNMAQAGDIVLIAGKGHEDYQEIHGVRNRFSDREAIESALRGKLKKSESGL